MARPVDLVQALSKQLGHAPYWSCQAPSGQLTLAQWQAHDTDLLHPPSDTCTLVFHLAGSTRVAGFYGNQCVGQGVRQSSITLLDSQSSRWALDGELSFVHLYLPRSVLDQHVRQDQGIATAPWLRPCFAKEDPWLHGLFSLLIQDHVLNPQACEAPLLDSLAPALLAHLLRFYTHAAPPSQPARRETCLGNGMLRKIEQYLDEHLSEAIVLEDLARLASVSPGHLLRAFRQTTGVTPHQFLIDRRLAHARQLLGDPALSLECIARRAGFASASHLGETFRKRLGVTPGQFRAMHTRFIS